MTHQHAIDQHWNEHHMQFHSAQTGYILSYRCKACGHAEYYDCGDIEHLLTYQDARRYPLIDTTTLNWPATNATLHP